MIDPVDAIIRHQVYLEGLKNGEAERFAPVAEAAIGALVVLLSRFGYERVSDMPKAKLRAFVAAYNKKIGDTLTKFGKEWVRILKRIVGADLGLTRAVYQAISPRRLPATPFTAADMWKRATNEPMPGTGYEPLALIRQFFAGFKRDATAIIKRAYAEKWTPEQLLAAFRGTKAANFKDGLARKARRQFDTVAQTVIQHLHAAIAFSVGSLLFERYQWVSVLDANTTDVCRSRHGNVYDYASGPRPPAHFNCRSTIMPVIVAEPVTMPNSFFDWLTRQPRAVQDSILGRRAADLRNGLLTSRELPRFDGTRALTPEEFAARRDLILA